MHWIQKEILKTLSTSESCRYSDLKPATVDGNLFMYHLKRLINDGYVKNQEKKYLLTSKGKSFIAGMSLSTGKTTKIPRIFAMLYAKNKNGEVLLYKWSKQPYLDHTSLPFNRVRYGRSIKDTALDVLEVKTGLKSKVIYRGITEVIINKSKRTSTHYISHIFELKDPAGEPSADGLTGKPFWDTLDNYSGLDLVYGTKEIVKTLETKKSPFFEEIFVEK